VTVLCSIKITKLLRVLGARAPYGSTRPKLFWNFTYLRSWNSAEVSLTRESGCTLAWTRTQTPNQNFQGLPDLRNSLTDMPIKVGR